MQNKIKIGNFEIGNELPLALLCGPCQIESKEHAIMIAEEMVKITKELGMNYIFKASFDKANRTSINGARGVGIEKGIETFQEIKERFGCPIVTDVHEVEQCAKIAPYVDMLQIPAFLCRQTDLVVAAAKTGKIVNVKKGQFLAPWDMPNIIKKVTDSGNSNVCITERGTSFGYNTLITDFRGISQMAKDTGCPIIFDATHSVQQPGGKGASTGGQREYAPVLARASVSVGAAAAFIETHDNPDMAMSDGPNSIALHDMKDVLEDLIAFDKLSKARTFKKLGSAKITEFPSKQEIIAEIKAV